MIEQLFGFSGKIFPSGLAADSYKRAVDSAIEKLRNQEVGDLSKAIETPSYVSNFLLVIETLLISCLIFHRK